MNLGLKEAVVVLSRLTQEDIDLHTSRQAKKGSKRKWHDRLKKQEANRHLRDVSRVDFTLFDDYRRQRQHFLKKKAKKPRVNSSGCGNIHDKSNNSLSQKGKCNQGSSQKLCLKQSPLSNGSVLPLHLKRNVSASTFNNTLEILTHQNLQGNQSYLHVKNANRSKRPVIYDSDSDCSIENYGIVFSERDSSNFIQNQDRYFNNASNKPASQWNFSFDTSNQDMGKTPSPIVNEHDILSALTFEQQDDLSKAIMDKFPTLATSSLKLNSKDFKTFVEEQTNNSSLQCSFSDASLPQKEATSASASVYPEEQRNSLTLSTHSGTLQLPTNIFTVPSFVNAENENFISEVKNKYHNTDISKEFDVVSKIMLEMDAQFISNNHKVNSSDTKQNNLPPSSPPSSEISFPNVSKIALLPAKRNSKSTNFHSDIVKDATIPDNVVSAGDCSINIIVMDILAKIVEEVSNGSNKCDAVPSQSVSRSPPAASHSPPAASHSPPVASHSLLPASSCSLNTSRSSLITLSHNTTPTSSNSLQYSHKLNKKCVRCKSFIKWPRKTCARCQTLSPGRFSPVKGNCRDSKGFPYKQLLSDRINKAKANKGKSQVWQKLSKFDKNRLAFVNTHCNQVRRPSAVPFANSLRKKAVALSPVKVIKPTVVHLKNPPKSRQFAGPNVENFPSCMPIADKERSLSPNSKVIAWNDSNSSDPRKVCAEVKNVKKKKKKKKHCLYEKKSADTEITNVLPSGHGTIENVSKVNSKCSEVTVTSKRDNIEMKEINQGLFLMTIPEPDQEIELSPNKESSESEPLEHRLSETEEDPTINKGSVKDLEKIPISDKNDSPQDTNGHEISCAYLIPQISSIVVAKYSSQTSVGDYHLSGVFLQNRNVQTQSDQHETLKNIPAVEQHNMPAQQNIVIENSEPKVSTSAQNIVAVQLDTPTTQTSIPVQQNTPTVQKSIPRREQNHSTQNETDTDTQSGEKPIQETNPLFSEQLQSEETLKRNKINAETSVKLQAVMGTSAEHNNSKLVQAHDPAEQCVESKYCNLVLHELDAIAILSILDLDNSKSRSEQLLKNLLHKEYEELSSMKGLTISELDADLKDIVAAKVNQVLGKIRSLHFARTLLKSYGTLPKIIDAVLQTPELPTLALEKTSDFVDTSDFNSSSDSRIPIFATNPKSEGRQDCRFASNMSHGNEMLNKILTSSEMQPNSSLIPASGQNNAINSSNGATLNSVNSTAFLPAKVKGEKTSGSCCMQKESNTQFNIIEKMQQQISSLGPSNSCPVPFPQGSSFMQSFASLANSPGNSGHSPSFQQTQSPVHLNPSPNQPTCSPLQRIMTPNHQTRSPVMQTPSPVLQTISPQLPGRQEIPTSVSSHVNASGSQTSSGMLTTSIKQEKQTNSEFGHCAMQNPRTAAPTAATTVSNIVLLPNAGFQAAQFRQQNSNVHSNVQHFNNQFLRPQANVGPPPNQTVPFSTRHVLPFAVNRPSYGHMQQTSNPSTKNILRLPNGDLVNRAVRVNQVVIPNPNANLRQYAPYPQNQFNRIIQNNASNNYSIRLQSISNHAANAMVLHGNNPPVSLRNSSVPQGVTTYSNTSNYSNVPQAAWNKDAANIEMSLLACAVCSKPAKLRCKQCTKVSYCGPDCAKFFWQMKHKAECQPQA